MRSTTCAATAAPDTQHYSVAGNLGSQAFALYVRAMLGDQTQAATAMVSEKAADLRQGVCPRARCRRGARIGVLWLVGRPEELAGGGQGDALIAERMTTTWRPRLRTTAIVRDAGGAGAEQRRDQTAGALMNKRRAELYRHPGEIVLLLALSAYAWSRRRARPR
jgi:hypothetical protein